VAAESPKPHSPGEDRPKPELVGGIPWYTYPSEKCEFANGNDYPIYEMENQKCLKPPTSENWDLFRNLVHSCNIP